MTDKIKSLLPDGAIMFIETHVGLLVGSEKEIIEEYKRRTQYNIDGLKRYQDENFKS